MPELPEVETFRRFLAQGKEGFPAILGKEFQGGKLLWQKTLASPDPDTFFSRLPGQIVEETGRRGKHLLLHLSVDTLIFHFRMSGELLVEPQEKPLGKHVRLVLNFQDSYRLAFHNVRKFGRVWLTPDPEEFLSFLGPEPLGDDFRARDLYDILHAQHRQIKYLLLDQRAIAGLGNIYTDEALYLSKIHPRTKSDALSFAQVKDLWSNIRHVLRTGIKNQGTSIDWMYKGGDYQRLLHVYKRTGDPCERCGTPIERILVAQRSTHICPVCQNLPEDEVIS
jgi:formamidopyrimidine-DNA glycosylase